MNREEYMNKISELTPVDFVNLNELAGEFYEAHGYNSEDIKFLKSSHPQEQFMFQLAIIAKDFFEPEFEE